MNGVEKKYNGKNRESLDSDRVIDCIYSHRNTQNVQLHNLLINGLSRKNTINLYMTQYQRRSQKGWNLKDEHNKNAIHVKE